MLSAVTVQLQGEKDRHHGDYIASLLQGYLMEKVDPAFAEQVHQSQLHPYSQYVTTDKESMNWHIGLLTDEARQAVVPVFTDPGLHEICLTHRDETLRVLGVRTEEISEEDLIGKYYFGAMPRTLKIRFETPTSFKQNGEYMIYPTPRLIFQSLMNKFEANSEASSIASPDLVDTFEKNIKVVGYRMRSTKFSLEGTGIPSFAGDVTLRISGPQQMVNLTWLLAVYGEYAGIGIKTGMGMGGMTVLDKEKAVNA